MGGEETNLKKDKEILKISTKVGGPFLVVQKNVEERWAIVALEWDGQPRFGIRWFWGPIGMPSSHAKPTWFLIPESLENGILSTSPMRASRRRQIEEFLCGNITGDDLAKI
jgi:hypothetical protein